MSNFVVALSGGIGSGKSTVASAFARLGIATIDTDEIARQLTAPGGGAIAAIRAAFGEALLTPEGALDRAAMRNIVFADPDARARLEAILHPMIRACAQALADAAPSRYALLEIPLLAETGARDRYGFIDRVLIVDCDEATRIRRVMARSALSDAEVRRIIAAQADDATRLALADDTITNNGDLADLETAVAALHESYERLATEKVKTSC